MVLQSAPLPGVYTPGGNPAARKAMMKNLSNKFRVVHPDGSFGQLEVGRAGRKIGSQVYGKTVGAQGSFAFRATRAE